MGKIFTLIFKQVNYYEIRKLWICAGRQDSFRQHDDWMEKKFDATTIYVLVYEFLSIDVHCVRTFSISFSFVFFI